MEEWTKPMETLEDILLKVKENPEKYLGEKSIDKLDHFIGGYISSQLSETKTSPKWIFPFNEFIAEKFGIKACVRSTHIVRLFSASDECAFDRYFELLEEFHERQVEDKL